MRHYLLEPNVRDYQGVQNPVNKAIRETLHSQTSQEFWWLNNGITIVTDKCSVGADGITIVGTEIVNGLQTCHEIFNYFQAGGAPDEHSVLVRVIEAPEEQSRNDITKATNNQTPVSALSLRATEPLHFEIEDRLAVRSVL